MDDTAFFLITIFIVLLVFLNFYYMSNRNDQIIIKSVAALAILVDTKIKSMEDQIEEIDGRVTALEEAGAGALSANELQPMLTRFAEDCKTLNKNNLEIMSTFGDVYRKLGEIDNRIGTSA
ncbi:MAG: hypothetical protein MUO31_05425 [Thermodesulfovibrionales bacterium]|nr:hypothetical protein [Thermodesulfovibrionales bacterium]